MPDSDNTTTRSLVTRRTILGKGTIAIAAIVDLPRRAFGHDASAVGLSSDPAVVLWRKWRKLHQRTEELCRWQQQLEQKLVETVGFPRAPDLSGVSESEMAQTFRIGHEMLHAGKKDVASRGMAETDFIAHQTRWKAADEEIGYSATLRAEREESERAEGLLRALSGCPATSLVGVAAKLDAVLKEGEVNDDGGEFPWPQIRSAFEDIQRIGEQMKPSHAFPNELRQPKSS